MTRRFTAPDRTLRELEVLQRLAVALPRALTVAGVTDALARELVLAVERADECCISSWEPEHDRLLILSSHNRRDGYDELYRNAVYSLDDWPESRRLLTDGRGHCEYRRSDSTWSPAVAEQLREWSWTSWISVPLVAGNRSVGLVELIDYGSERRWSVDDITFLRTVASQAAMAVRNAQLNEQLERQVERDPLTGLLSHRAFYQRVATELANVASGRPEASVMVLDIDGFRAVNDLGGHLIGDMTLRRVADVLREVAGDDGLCGRIGGDEFAVLLPGVEREAPLVANRIATLLDRDAGVTASVGIAVCGSSDSDAAAVIDRAERALREAKRDGKRTLRMSA
jgi:diguanylate cyclase (GGDEF)-like protein